MTIGKSKKLSRAQAEIVDIMLDNPEYNINSNQYEHLQCLTDNKSYAGDFLPFRKYFFKSTLNCLIKIGCLQIIGHNGNYPIYKLKNYNK